MELTPEEIADIAKINGFRKPHTLAKFDLAGKSEAVVAAATAKKAEFDAAGAVDDGKDDDDLDDDKIIAEVRAAVAIPELYVLQAKYPERSQAVNDAINERGTELDAILRANAGANSLSGEPGDGLMVMTKDDQDDIRVHPTQIKTWEAQGWTVAE